MKLILQAIKALFRKIEASRTHWDTRKTETVTLTFDGNPDGKQTILIDGTSYLVKISNEPIPMADMIGAQLSLYESLYEDSETSYISVQEDDITSPSKQIYIVRGELVWVALEDTELDGLSFTRGVWVLCIKDNQGYEAYVASLSCDIVTGELKKLDEKYLPDSIYNKIETAQTTANSAQTTADSAQTTADSAQTTANSKMNKNNPTGTGSFSLNRKSGTAVGAGSFVCGLNNTASANYSHAEGDATKATGYASHAEGGNTKATSSDEGRSTTSSTNKGYYTHAEGYGTVAYGRCSHAEGNGAKAKGNDSHAEGCKTIASGDSSHAEGSDTTASSSSQHVQGKYNVEDSSNVYADIIGNGTTESNRSNAATVDWSGNAWYAGDVYVGSTSGTNKDAGSKKLATEEYASALGITNATVGQIAKITAVDSNGKPTAWEPVDLPSGGGSEVDPPLLVDYTVPDGSTASSITFTAADDGTAFNLNNRCYFVVDAIFPDSTSKTIGIVSNGNTQGSGPFSPGNLTNVTVTEMHIFGKYTREFGTRYTTWVQYRPNVNNGYPTSDSTQYGRSDHALLMENTKGTAVKSLMFVAMGTGDTIYWAPGTRVRIWGN